MAAEDYELRLQGNESGSLIVRALLKVFIIILLAVQFIPGFGPIGNWWIVLGILFYGYFQMPTQYYTDKPYKKFQAWFRMGIGFALAIVVMVALSPGTPTILDFIWLIVIFGGLILVSIVLALMKLNRALWFLIIFILLMVGLPVLTGTGNLPQASPLFFLTLAFFFSIPKKIDRSEDTGEKVKL